MKVKDALKALFRDPMTWAFLCCLFVAVSFFESWQTELTKNALLTLTVQQQKALIADLV